MLTEKVDKLGGWIVAVKNVHAHTSCIHATS